MKQARCGCCAERRNYRRDFRQGGVEIADFDETPRLRKNLSGRGTCKKSKSGEKCVFTGTAIVGTEPFYVMVSGIRQYAGRRPRKIRCCIRCGRHDWTSYNWSF